MADLNKQLGKRIKQIRKTAKLTQERLAEKTGLSIEYISRIERGIAQPSLKTIEKMVEVLNVEVRSFFDFKAPVLFRDKNQEANKKKEYIDAILSKLKDLEIHELVAVYNVVKGLINFQIIATKE